MTDSQSNPSSFNQPETTQTGTLGCPVLGVGLGLRRPVFRDTLKATDQIDWLEFTPENYMARGGKTRSILEKAKALYPLVSHGVSLSVAGSDPFSEAYLSELETLFEWIDPPWFSDHLCFSEYQGQYFNDLMPVPHTHAVASYVADRLKYLQDRFQRPVLIENISQYVHYAGEITDDLSESAFISAIVNQADAGVLLDVNNVYVNAINHTGEGQTAYAAIDAMPLDRVVQIHVAGHFTKPKGSVPALVDTHGESVCDPVWDLLRYTMARCKPCGVMLERDGTMPAFTALLDEIATIRTIWNDTQPAISPVLTTQEPAVSYV